MAQKVPLTSSGLEATLKRVELLMAAVPGVTRLAVLTNQDNPAGRAFVREAQAAAQRFNVRIVSLHAAGVEQIDAAFSAMARENADALMLPPDALFNSQRRQIVRLAASTRIPAIYPLREYFAIGGLLVYGPDLADQTRRAATYVDRILKGAKPGELPVEQTRKFSLFVNLKTAKALGITVSQEVLLRADEVIH